MLGCCWRRYLSLRLTGEQRVAASIDYGQVGYLKQLVVNPDFKPGEEIEKGERDDGSVDGSPLCRRLVQRPHIQGVAGRRETPSLRPAIIPPEVLAVLHAQDLLGNGYPIDDRLAALYHCSKVQGVTWYFNSTPCVCVSVKARKSQVFV